MSPKHTCLTPADRSPLAPLSLHSTTLHRSRPSHISLALLSPSHKHRSTPTHHSPASLSLTIRALARPLTKESPALHAGQPTTTVSRTAPPSVERPLILSPRSHRPAVQSTPSTAPSSVALVANPAHSPAAPAIPSSSHHSQRAAVTAHRRLLLAF